jgi:hypothetical protein
MPKFKIMLLLLFLAIVRVLRMTFVIRLLLLARMSLLGTNEDLSRDYCIKKNRVRTYELRNGDQSNDTQIKMDLLTNP